MRLPSALSCPAAFTNYREKMLNLLAPTCRRHSFPTWDEEVARRHSAGRVWFCRHLNKAITVDETSYQNLFISHFIYLGQSNFPVFRVIPIILFLFSKSHLNHNFKINAFFITRHRVLLFNCHFIIISYHLSITNTNIFRKYYKIQFTEFCTLSP